MADVFLSYAREDKPAVQRLAAQLEAAGLTVWWDHNLAGGARYLETTETELTASKAVVVCWSQVSIKSHWVADEATIGRDEQRLVPISLDGSQPPLGFRQFQVIDFTRWGHGDTKALPKLLEALGSLVKADPIAPQMPADRRGPPGGVFLKRWLVVVAPLALVVVGLVAWAAWESLKPSAAAAHSMTVRLAGFQLLSPDLPATLRATVDAEIAAAFNADGVVGVSTASAPALGSTPGYALGGTIQRDGQTIRVITRLTNERSGATVWGDTFNYENEAAKVPRHIAVDAGNVVRCGLFGASTYRKALPDAVLRDYMQFCRGHWNPILADGRKALVPAQRVVAAVPDFSWGWAAVAGAYWKVVLSAGSDRVAEEGRANGRQAADRALAIDARNSEALYIKAVLAEPSDWIGKEALFKRAVAARRLDCGCEHHQYGTMLQNVGRVTEAVEQLRQAHDMLALYIYTPLSLADALVAAGETEEAKPIYDAAIQLAPDSGFAERIAMYKATATGDIDALQDPGLPMAPELRAALLAGHRAAKSANAGAKAQAVKALLALPPAQQSSAVSSLLGDLGAAHEAFVVGSRLATRSYPRPSVFWYPSMRGALADPGFPAVATQLGLMNYWRTTQTRPDACSDKSPPPFCAMI